VSLRLRKRIVWFKISGLITLSMPAFLFSVALNAYAQAGPASQVATALAGKDLLWAALFVAAINGLLAGWLVKTLVDVVQRTITNESRTAEELRQIRHMLGEVKTPQH